MNQLNPNTLRVGNLLMDQEGRYGIVKGISKGKIEWEAWPHVHEERNYNSCMPVPITEEWIAKYAGTDESPFINEHTKSYPLNWPVFHHLVVKTDGEIRLYAPNTEYRSVKFVHQLQNLYFSLTETELPLQ